MSAGLGISGIKFDADYARLNAGGHIGSFNTNIQNASNVTVIVGKDGIHSIHEGGLRYPECPRPASSFTGRDETLGVLSQYFFEEHNVHSARIFVLWGSTGSGKSQITYKFVHRSVLSRVPHVYLIDASTKDSIETALILIATVAKIETTVDAALKWLSSHEEQWFLVFKDFDDKTIDLQAYLPLNNRGRILVTTKHPANRQLGTREAHFSSSCHYQVSEMEYNEAVQLLLRTAQVNANTAESEYAGAIVMELGCHAQWIVRAGNTIIEAEMSIKAYLDSLSNRFLDLDTSLRQTVKSVYSEGYSQLGQNAKRILHLCSYLYHTGITIDMFRTAAQQVMTFKRSVPLTVQQDSLCKRLCDELAPYQVAFHRWDPTAFSKVLEELRSHSLIRYTPGDVSFSLPPMVPRWIQSLAPTNTQALAELFLFVSMPSKDLFSTQGAISRLRYLPHVNSVRRHRPVTDILVDAAAFFARVFHESGLWTAAEALQAVVLDTRSQILGQDHPATIHATTECARRLFDQGRREEATGLMEVALMGLRDVCREDNPEILQIMQHLGDFYLQQGRWRESREMYNAVLSRRKDTLGQDHPDTIVTEFCIGLLNSFDGGGGSEELAAEVKAASERLFTFLGPDDPVTHFAVACAALVGGDDVNDIVSTVQRCWSRLKEVAGEEHPVTLDVMAIVAHAHRFAGNGTEGQQVVDLLYETAKRIRGEDHPGTLDVMSSIAQYHFSFNRIPEAQELLIKLVDSRKRVLGPEDPDTLTSMDSLTRAYMQQSQFVKAEQLATEALQIRRRRLDRWHPNIAMSLSLCSELYLAQEKWVETEHTQKELITHLERTVSETSKLEVLVAQAVLVMVISCQGRFIEADRLHTELDEKLRRVGHQHIAKVHDANFYLGRAYRARLRYSDGVALHTDVLIHRATVLGENHISTLESAIHACGSYVDAGGLTHAEGFLEDVFKTLDGSVVPEHPLLLAAKRAEAWLNKVKGKPHQAVETYSKLLQTYTRLLGENHRLVLSITSELASACLAAGRYHEAKEHYASLLKRKGAIYERDHPETIAIEQDAVFLLDLEGMFKEALKKQTYIVDSRTRIFGASHPYTLKSRLLLSSTLVSMCHHSKAQRMQDEIIWTLSQTLGDVHPETLQAKLRLAINYFFQLRFVEAEQLLEAVEQQHTLTLGKTHPETMNTRYWLGKVYREQQKLRSAKEKLLEVATDRENILGQDEPDTWNAIDDLANVLILLKEFSVGERLLAGILEKARRRYGDQHVLFWGIRVTQVILYGMSSRAPQALQLSQTLLDQMVRSVGEDHPWCITIMEVQAGIQEHILGRPDLAKPLQWKVEKLRRQAGMDIPGGSTGSGSDSTGSSATTILNNNFKIPTSRRELLLQGLQFLMKP